MYSDKLLLLVLWCFAVLKPTSRTCELYAAVHCMYCVFTAMVDGTSVPYYDNDAIDKLTRD